MASQFGFSHAKGAGAMLALVALLSGIAFASGKDPTSANDDEGSLQPGTSADGNEASDAADGALEDGDILAWLHAQRRPFHTRTFTGGVVNWYGWFPSEELNPERVARLQNVRIRPERLTFSALDESTAQRRIEVVPLLRSRGPETGDVRCAALIQVEIVADSTHSEREMSRILADFRSLVPEYPVDATCAMQSPSAAGYELGDRFATNDGPTILGPGSLVTIDTERSCADFADGESGVMSIPDHPKVRLRQFINFEPTPMASRVKLHQLFGAYTRAFHAKMYRDASTDAQYIHSDHLTEMPDLIELDFSVIQESENDQLCLVAQFRQGDASWTAVEYLAAEDHTLGMGSGPRNRRTWWPVELIREFGEQTAQRLIAN